MNMIYLLITLVVLFSFLSLVVHGSLELSSFFLLTFHTYINEGLYFTIV